MIDEAEKLRRDLTTAGIEVIKHPRAGLPASRTIHLNEPSMELSWIGKNGRKKVIDLRPVQEWHVMRSSYLPPNSPVTCEVMGKAGSQITYPSMVFVRTGFPDNAKRYVSLIFSKQYKRRTLDLEFSDEQESLLFEIVMKNYLPVR